MRFFVERATAAQPAFRFSASNAAAVASVCTRLDGIPLALEMAAAWVRVLTPEQIDGRLSDRFRLLLGGSRTALPRQQTLRALVAEPSNTGQVRYRLLQSSHFYARERLAQMPGAVQAQARKHRDFFLALAEEAEPHLLGAGQALWLDALERDLENLRSALAFSRGATAPCRALPEHCLAFGMDTAIFPKEPSGWKQLWNCSPMAQLQAKC